jgi:alpha-beta hydrolase superfamily lysophospholipase
LKTYLEIDSWKNFQPYFPEEWRINDHNYPDEYYWEWGKYHVHIDCFKPKKKSKKIKLILLHGGGGNGRLLSPIAVCFSSMGFECVAPDLPGFGLTKSDEPNSYYTWIDLVNDLISYESKKTDSQIVLCGISLGGNVSLSSGCFK